MIPVDLVEKGARIFFEGNTFALKDEIKAMAGAKYHGYDEVEPRKVWSVANSRRNRFQIAYLAGKNPYAPWEVKLDWSMIPATRFNTSTGKDEKILTHQFKMAAEFIQHPGHVCAGEMGTGKSLPAIIALEILSLRFTERHGFKPEIWFIGPLAAIYAVKRQCQIWQSKVEFTFMTNERATSVVKNWKSGTKAPPFIWIDESSRVKNFQSQRSQAAFELAEGARRDWTQDLLDQITWDAKIIETTGTPAPKSPLDWWSQAEIACPGYLKEGDIYKFKHRLAVIIQKENFANGGSYPELVTWRDSEAKCQMCGRESAHENHIPGCAAEVHKFIPGINEVEKLYKRLSGLVSVYLKKDCLDLPDKTYIPIEVKPDPSVVRVASLIKKTSKTTIEGLTLLRELSDGFQYVEVKDGEKQCDICNGLCQIADPESEGSKIPCPNCKGKGQIPKYRRSIETVKCPKDQIVQDLLDQYEDVGRVIFFGGFTGTIDRLTALCLKEKWAVIRYDEGKVKIFGEDGVALAVEDFQSMFQDWKDKYPRVAYVATPESGGMSLTLTASPMACYYSNSFNGEARMQSEDRGHRPGMDLNKGFTIYDIFHLPSDQHVVDNLKKKRDLQSMSLGEFIEDQHIQE